VIFEASMSASAMSAELQTDEEHWWLEGALNLETGGLTKW